ncbi:unnamed protein product [Spirodela intermedia]|uniref:Uncharacterized protein n=2 Tax=Spirodela intermedia TaxID=51605 RepID=A0A7I8J6R3_SPIIN|nr:unnamed protein product [Spirodela intermedia]CAA6665926.1 unnamed protein product [Spirodela intermedia]CAA7402684.1 unnamed protein product [Spirodela intermedia]
MKKNDDRHRQKVHYSTVSSMILEHKVLGKGGPNHPHHNTFYFIKWVGQS